MPFGERHDPWEVRLAQHHAAYDAFRGAAVVVRAEPLPESGSELGGPGAAPVAAGEDADQLVLVPRDRARREGAQVEIGAAGRLVGFRLVGVDHDRPVQTRVVEHQCRVVGDEDVRGQAERLHARVAADVEDPAPGLGERTAVAGVRAGQHHEAGTEADEDPLQVQGGALGAPVVAVGGRVEDRDRPLGDAERLAQPGHVRGRRPLEDVGAGLAVLQRGVAAGVDAFPGQGGVTVGGDDVVPGVDLAQQPGEVGAAGGGRAFLEVQAHVLEGRPSLRLDQHLALPLDQAGVEGGVVHQVAGAGQRRPVGGRAGRQAPGAGRDGAVVRGVGGPRRADVRREVAERLLQRARVAAVPPVTVGGEDGTVGAQGEAALDAVVQPQGGGPRGAQQPGGALHRPAAQGRGQPQGLVGAAQAQPEQGVAQAHRQRGGGAGDPVAAAVDAGPAQELAAQGAREAVGAGEHRCQVVGHAAVEHRPPAGRLRVRLQEREDPVVLLEDVQVALARRPQDAAPPALPVADADPVQGGDGVRRQQDRVGPRRVLVVAGREGEALALGELPPHRLVPGHHQQLQQPRPVGEPERRRALFGEVPGGLVADRVARPERARVVVDQDVRLPGLLHPVGDGPQGVRGEGVVAVEEDQVVAARPLHPGVAGGAEALVLGQVHGAYARVAGRELVEDRAAGVRRAVVDRDQFEIRIGLRQHRLQALVQIRLNLVRGDDDTEPGHGDIHGSAGSARAFGPGTANGVTWLRPLRHSGDPVPTGSPRTKEGAGRCSARPLKGAVAAVT